ncbi:hypothetical protein [Lysobacter gummosus]|uniref:hypothetical protein n=1 Tax=Lysobacter gummosus TaxID=262324 RepID=UPI00364572E2
MPAAIARAFDAPSNEKPGARRPPATATTVPTSLWRRFPRPACPYSPRAGSVTAPGPGRGKPASVARRASSPAVPARPASLRASCAGLVAIQRTRRGDGVGAAQNGPPKRAVIRSERARSRCRGAARDPQFWKGVFSAKYSWLSALSSALVGLVLARFFAPA